MANITETDSFDAGVYQLETTDPALGGANGVMNTPPRSLANRTRFLLNRILDGVLSFVADSGAKNAIVASFPQPIAALIDGMEVSFRVAVLNDAGVTLKLTNTGGPVLPTLALWGSDHVALVGGELPAGATVTAKLNLTLNASNGGAWVISSVTGGYSRILTPPSGDMSNRAANMAAVFNATDGMATVNVGVGTDVVLTAAQTGCAILKLTGTPTAAINLVLPGGQTGQWVINNQQGGTNNITVKPSGGTGVVLPQGATPTIIVSDGTTASFASAQAAQSAFSILPFSGITGTTLTVPGGYTPGSIFIEKNGGVLEPADFTATVNPTITLTKAAVSTDVFNVYRFTSFTVADAVQKSGDTMAGPLAVQAATASENPVQLGQMNDRVGSAGPLSFRNKLHNPLFVVNQRSYVSGAVTTVANQLTLDRWKVVTSGQKLLFTASGNSFIVTAPAGGIAQVIEDIDVEGGTYCLAWTGTATATVNGASVANGGNFALPAKTNATVVFSGGTLQYPQLEIGTAPTETEQRPFVVEMLLCSRFYTTFIYVGGGSSVANNQISFSVPVSVPMRALPAATNLAGNVGSGYASTYSGTAWFQALVGANAMSANGIGNSFVECVYPYSGAANGWPASIAVNGTFSADI